ncbi:hypothetical protein F4703DRAFT_1100616 [Phycomyces blakesleeanus]
MQFTIYSISTNYTVHNTQYTVHSTQHTVHSTQYTVHSTQYTVHSTQYTVHNTPYKKTIYKYMFLCMCTCTCVWLYIPNKEQGWTLGILLFTHVLTTCSIAVSFYSPDLV